MSTIAGLLPVRRAGVVRAGVIAACGLGGVLLGTSMTTPLFPFTLCFAVAGLLAVFAFFDAGPAMLSALTFLLFLGGERRVFEYGLETGSALVDPLFLIPPLVTLALLAVAARRGAFLDRGPLASVVYGITVVGVVGAVNPLQGSLLAGGIGLVIFMTPVLWFWIGRGLVDDRRIGQVFAVTAVAAVLSGLYGILQTSGFFFSWDQAWVEASEEYAALRIQGVVRGFGFSSSAAEYGKLLAAGFVVIGASLVARHRVWWLPLVGLLSVALFLSGLRTTLVLAVVAAGIIWGTRRRASIVQLTVYGGLAVVVLMLVAAQIVPSSGGSGAADVLADRQVEGITDPFNPKSSTLGSHVELVVKAFTGMVTAPIGQGTATITIAGKRFGASAAGDTDLADAAIAFGLVGVALYLLLCVRLFRAAHLLAVRRGDTLALAAIGIVVVSSLQWLNGGLYAANVLAWLTFGWIDRASAELADGSVAETTEEGRVGAGTLAV